MAELADAFVAMPGGFGTFEEFCEVVTWTQLGVHRKSCGLLNVGGFYDPLIAQFDRGRRGRIHQDGQPPASSSRMRTLLRCSTPLARIPAPPEAP